MIRPTKFILLALLAVAMAGVATAGIASAGMGLPGFLNKESASILASKVQLLIEGGASTKCDSIQGSSSPSSSNLGLYTLDFLECTEGVSQPCKSLGDVELTVLVKGEYHLVLLEGSPMKWFMLLLLPTELHIECPGGAIKLFLVKGGILGLSVKKAGEKAKLFEVIFTQGNGVQSEKFFENNAGTLVEESLLLLRPSK